MHLDLIDVSFLHVGDVVEGWGWDAMSIDDNHYFGHATIPRPHVVFSISAHWAVPCYGIR